MEQNKMRLTNPLAQPSAQKLFDYLSAVSGKGILSGQQEFPRDQTHGDELSYIKDISGRLPAILGLDYIDNDFEGVNERAIAWHERGGIVTICWHWGIPPYGVGYPSSKEEVDMEELLTPGTALHQGMLENMDAVAEALSALCKKEIPVLWRPFHEFDGAWFWWGKGCPEAFKKLWCLMYKRFTEMHGLHNLIWVLGYSHEMREGWYPGDEYVDIIGGDAYVEGIHEELFNWIKTVTDKPMPRCLHENGPLPEPGLLAQKKVDWCWFLTWHTVHIHEQNSSDYLRYVYNHPYVITLENLPKL